MPSRKWKSSNSSVLSVNSSGVITAKKAGTATITVTTADGYSSSRSYTVREVTRTTTARFSSSNCTTVKLNANSGSGYINIYTYDMSGIKTSTKIHVALRDTQGNWIWEGDVNSGDKLKLGNDHSVYRVYIRAASYPNTIKGQSDSFINTGKCYTWKIKCSSKTYIG